MNLKRGEAKIEFFRNLDYFKKEVEGGLIVSKILYQKAKKDKNLKMNYGQFNKYFNEFFKDFIVKLKLLKLGINTKYDIIK